MPDEQRFIVFIVAAFLVFVAVLRFTNRNRAIKPSLRETSAVAIVVVVVGMLFARYTHLEDKRGNVRAAILQSLTALKCSSGKG
jgi:hypothetical protein